MANVNPLVCLENHWVTKYTWQTNILSYSFHSLGQPGTMRPATAYVNIEAIKSLLI